MSVTLSDDLKTKTRFMRQPVGVFPPLRMRTVRESMRALLSTGRLSVTYVVHLKIYFNVP